ncbi:MAG: hypothetical protein ACPGJU_09165 [Coraliomargarita sp.]
MRKLLVLTSLAATALVFTGCGGDTGKTAMGPKETNVLGIYKHQEANYTPTRANTFAIHTDELTSRANYSGDKTTLLWGFVTIKDY